jgi:hypothetical protein
VGRTAREASKSRHAVFGTLQCKTSRAMRRRSFSRPKDPLVRYQARTLSLVMRPSERWRFRPRR